MSTGSATSIVAKTSITSKSSLHSLGILVGMRPDQFTSSAFGEPKRRLDDKWAFWYFLPSKMPRSLDLDNETVYTLSQADAALGHLQGLGRLIRDPQLLVGPYLTREALASSRIEGTEASLSDVLQAEASGAAPRNENVAEVERYISATHYAVEAANRLPLSMRLASEAHRVLMQGVRGEEKLPGELRRSPVWVGGGRATPDTAKYVPPLPEHLGDLLTDWELFIHEDNRMPTLVRCALMHYQFETIHPFLDGNGRIGRLLIGLMLMKENRLNAPLLYLSGYLETHRREYYDRLQAVREEGDIQGWLVFFLQAVASQADDAVNRAAQLVEIRERYRAEVASARSRIGGVVDLLFANPFVTVARVERELGGTNQGARNLIKDAVSRGWIREIGSWGRGGRTYWVADEIWTVIDAATSYDVEAEGLRDGGEQLTIGEPQVAEVATRVGDTTSPYWP